MQLKITIVLHKTSATVGKIADELFFIYRLRNYGSVVTL